MANFLKLSKRNIAAAIILFGLGFTLLAYQNFSFISSTDSYVKVSSNYNSGCAITTNGALKCWGANAPYVGVVGDGTSLAVTEPKLIFSSGVTDVSSASNSTCAVVNGALSCWGALSSQDMAATRSPVTVIQSGVTQVAVSESSTYSGCVVVSGAVRCWDRYGHLSGANGRTDLRNIGSSTRNIFESGVTSVSVNGDSACAVVGGAMKCWGVQHSGEFDGTFVGAHATSPITVFSSGVAKVAVGHNSTCALLTNGSIKCLGWMRSGVYGADGVLLNAGKHTIVGSGATDFYFNSSGFCAVVGGSVQCSFDVTSAPTSWIFEEIIPAGASTVSVDRSICIIVAGELRCGSSAELKNSNCPAPSRPPADFECDAIPYATKYRVKFCGDVGACRPAQCAAGYQVVNNLCVANAPTCTLSQHLEGSVCVANTRSCGTIANGSSTQSWNGSAWGTCVVACNSGYTLSGSTCVAATPKYYDGGTSSTNTGCTRVVLSLPAIGINCTVRGEIVCAVYGGSRRICQ